MLSFQMTKTFRDKCDINIVQQTSCELLFPDFSNSVKNVLFPSVHPCMHHNYGVLSGRHTSADCVWPITLVAGHCSLQLPWRTSVSSHQVQYSIRTIEALLRENVYLFLERWKKMQSHYLYSSFFEHYNPSLLCD